jgi:ABC-type transport system substrate-binding protein
VRGQSLSAQQDDLGAPTIAYRQRLVDPAIGSVIRTTAGLIEKADAPDKYTVRFALTIAYASWPAVTAAFQASIVPRDAGDTLSAKPDGTGPFKFLSSRGRGQGTETLAKA